MNERFPSPAELKKKQEEQDAEFLADYLERHPEDLAPTKTSQERTQEIAEFIAMIDKFESTHPLAELNSIVDLSPELALSFEHADDLESPQRIEDAIKTYEKHNPAYVEVYKKKIATIKEIRLTPEEERKFKIWRAAKKDLAPIVTGLNKLKGDADYEELKAKYMHLGRAVGNIRGNIVDHTR